MKNSIENHQKELEQIFQQEEVVLAYLFGSVVRGTAGPESDIDIAVLFSKEQPDVCFEQRISLASKLEKGADLHNVEIICLYEAPPLLKHRAVLSGQLLYATTPQIKRDMELRALQEHEDFSYHLAVANKALRKHIFQNTLGKAPLPVLNPHKF